jgi:hypothetical protein
VISKPIKNDASNYGINLKKITEQSSHNNSSDVTCWETIKPIKIKHFLWVQGGSYGFGLWEVKMLWVWIMGVTLVEK